MVLRMLMVIMLVFFVAGCATTGTESARKSGQSSEMAALKVRVEDNERTIESLQAQLDRAGQKEDYAYSDSGKSAPEVASTPKRIQKALNNAGYYEGKIDGKIGKMSRKAIKEFQADKGLKADGVVGSKTWAKLGTYLD